VPTTPVPRQPLAGTWARAESAPVDATPLGRINHLAVDHLTLTVPSTVLDPAGLPVPLSLLELRIHLLRRSTQREVRDRTWRHIGEMAAPSGATGTCSPWAWPIPGCAPGHGNSPKG